MIKPITYLATVMFAMSLPAMAGAAPTGTSQMNVPQTNGTATATTAVKPMIHAYDQEVHGKTVTVSEVVTPRNGFVVIHAEKNGKPVAPQHLGYAPVKAGVDQSIKVKLDRAAKPGTKLIAMLHNDTGKKGKFEFAAGRTDVDTPMMRNGKPVISSFKIQK